MHIVPYLLVFGFYFRLPWFAFMPAVGLERIQLCCVADAQRSVAYRLLDRKLYIHIHDNIMNHILTPLSGVWTWSSTHYKVHSSNYPQPKSVNKKIRVGVMNRY